MLRYGLFEGENELEKKILDYYENGGKSGEEPPEIRDAMNKMKEYGKKYKQMIVDSGGWM